MKGLRHYWILAGILLLGAGLRFWNLDAKPLWMDEVLTALFSYGRSFLDVPYERVLPLSAFEQIFTLNSNATCSQIATIVSTQSVHPPLFFCWLHQWLGVAQGLSKSWVWVLRSLPALLGIVAIAAAYQLNRTLFSRKAGLASAAIMATSPFAVYLSQEARHYTLPMVLVILALLGLYQVLQNLLQSRLNRSVWLGWVVINGVGFYVHYFFLLAFVAQAAILILEGRRHHASGSKLRGGVGERTIYWAIAAVCLSYLPWLPTFIGHVGRPETDWMNVHSAIGLNAIAPLYQLAIGWMVMLIALPVEQQPLWIAVLGIGIMVVFIGWLGRRSIATIHALWKIPETHLATRMLVLFTAFVVLEFLAIAYVIGKDLTQVPRYNFIFFPAICALLGATFSQSSGQYQERQAIAPRLPLPSTTPTSPDAFSRKLQTAYPKRLTSSRPATALLPSVWLVLLVGVLSSACVVNNLAFQKPYNPQQVAQTLALEPTVPSLTVSAYDDFQDVALGLSFAIRLNQLKPNQLQGDQLHGDRSTAPSHFAFLEQRQGYEPVWQKLSTLQQPLPFPLNLWVIAPGLKRIGYPERLTLNAQTNQPHQCQLDRAHHYRIGIPYQLYRCL
jgi:uncharacterized membrane protein